MDLRYHSNFEVLHMKKWIYIQILTVQTEKDRKKASNAKNVSIWWRHRE